MFRMSVMSTAYGLVNALVANACRHRPRHPVPAEALVFAPQRR